MDRNFNKRPLFSAELPMVPRLNIKYKKKNQTEKLCSLPLHFTHCMNVPSRGRDFLSSASSGGACGQQDLPLTGLLLQKPRGERSGHHGNY